MNWTQIEQQARKEGQVNWFNWYFQDRFRQQVASFEKQYDIKVVISDGDAQANINKFLAAKSQKIGDIDVLSVGGAAFNMLSPQKTFWGPLNTLLPDSGHLKYQIEGTDSHGYGVAFWGNQSGIAYDPQRIKEEDLPRTLRQFAAFMALHPSEFGLNAENGGSGPAFVEAVVRTLTPSVDYASGKADDATLARFAPVWNWFNQQKSRFVITASNADSLSRLSAGEFLLVPAWEDYVAGLQKKGEISTRIRVYIPDFGMPGGGNMVAIPANAPHKAAALLFIHWLTSPATQKSLNQTFAAVPQNDLAVASVSLIAQADRQKSFTWAAHPLGDRIKQQFIQNVILK
ncbi:extracellular solute-binding protein [Ewingella sp. S1.OA.A_B6]